MVRSGSKLSWRISLATVAASMATIVLQVQGQNQYYPNPPLHQELDRIIELSPSHSFYDSTDFLADELSATAVSPFCKSFTFLCHVRCLQRGDPRNAGSLLVNALDRPDTERKGEINRCHHIPDTNQNKVLCLCNNGVDLTAEVDYALEGVVDVMASGGGGGQDGKDPVSGQGELGLVRTVAYYATATVTSTVPVYKTITQEVTSTLTATLTEMRTTTMTETETRYNVHTETETLTKMTTQTRTITLPPVTITATKVKTLTQSTTVTATTTQIETTTRTLTLAPETVTETETMTATITWTPPIAIALPTPFENEPDGGSGSAGRKAGAALVRPNVEGEAAVAVEAAGPADDAAADAPSGGAAPVGGSQIQEEGTESGLAATLGKDTSEENAAAMAVETIDPDAEQDPYLEAEFGATLLSDEEKAYAEEQEVEEEEDEEGQGEGEKKEEEDKDEDDKDEFEDDEDDEEEEEDEAS